MNFHPPTNALPRIVLSESEERRLSALATASALTGRSQSVARVLLAEIERAHVVRDRELPKGVVRMYSWVEFEVDGKDRRCVQLVWPGEADIARNKVSVLTPIGAALIGLSPGQTIPLLGHDGQPHRLTALKIVRHQSSADDNEQPTE